MNTEPTPKLPRSRSPLLAVLLIGGTVISGLLILGILPRLQRQAELQAAVEEQTSAVPTVNVVRARRAPASGALLLPGNVQALQETTIAARADGFVRRRLVDIGDRVRTGQRLAELETPEVDQQLGEARAALAQVKAQRVRARRDADFARTTYRRWQQLVAEGAVSEQDAEERRSALDVREADVAAAEANVAASEANVRRLVTLQAFRNVSAPYDGVVTERNLDTGALVEAGNNGRGLFRIARIDTLRIFVNVPQNLVRSIRTGQTVDVDVQEFPGRKFIGKVTRTASALDPTARTLLTEVRLPNSDRSLLPGMYAQVTFELQRVEPPLLIPASALLTGTEGARVAIVNTGRVHFQKVTLGRDLGSDVEVLAGLTGQEQLVTNPSDAVSEGTPVQVASKPPVQKR